MSDDELPESLAAGLALDDGPGPARPIDAAAADAMVARALTAGVAPVVSLAARRAKLWVAAGAAVVVTAAAAALVLTREDRAAPPAREAPAVHERSAAPDARPREGRRPLSAAEIEARLRASRYVMSSTGAPSLPPDPAARAAQERVRRRIAAAERPPRRREVRPPPPPMVREPVVSPALPEDLLAAANALRAQKNWIEAERAYRRVVDQHPSSDAAYVAGAAAGALRLERLGDPRGALSLLEGARRAKPSGPLDPELRLGIAEAYLAIGQRSVARRELIDLADRYPTSPQADAARRRLGRP